VTDQEARCIQIIGTRHGTARCSRTGTHLTPSGKRVCAQHARRYDVLIGKESRG
jgi:hypothetical protein